MLVDTSVWSLAFRRDVPADHPAVGALAAGLRRGDALATTGIIFQELLQGLRGPKHRAEVERRLRALDLIEPSLDDHVRAAEVRSTCRRKGVQLGTVDALIAALAIDRQLPLLTTDRDFEHAARFIPLDLWRP